MPKITVAGASRNVVIENNLSGGIRGEDGQADWTVSGNVFVQNVDAGADDHYSKHFVAPYGQLGGQTAKLQLRPDSPLHGTDVGAAKSHYDPAPDALTALIMQQAGDGLSTFRFDAGLSAGPDGALDDGARFEWQFGDGNQATGREVEHHYKAAGVYTTTLTVIDAGGARDVTTSQVRIAGPELVRLNPDDGALMAVAFGEERVLLEDPDGGNDAVLDLSLLDDAIPVSRAELRPIFETGSFEIKLSMASQPGTSPAGEVMRLKGALTVTVDATGEIVMDVGTLDGVKNTVTSKNARLQDGNWHDVMLTYDAGKGEIGISVDGGPAETTAINAPMATVTGRDLMLGNTFGDQAYGGKISAFSVRAGADGYQQDSAIPQELMDKLLDMENVQPVLEGSDGRDILYAGAQSHIIEGKGGDDRLWSGSGDDLMLGGTGADKFVFDLRKSDGQGVNKIMDLHFDAGDRLHILTNEAGFFDAAAQSPDDADV